METPQEGRGHTIRPRLPSVVRPLLEAFLEGLKEVLSENLVGIYLLGSVAFPGFVPRGDIDFYAVVHRELWPREWQNVRALHKALTQRFPHGDLLDGLFLPLPKAQRTEHPRGLLGLRRRDIVDEEWPYHREHIHRGAFIVLHGRDPRAFMPPVSWPELATALDGSLSYVEGLLHEYPFWCVMNLCRLVCTWETREVAVSKVQGADWALTHLPSRWEPLIRSALRVYRDQERAGDQQLLAEGVDDFFSYASERVAVARQETH